MFRCLQAHDHESDGDRAGCDAQHHDSVSLMKMAQVGFAGPAKIARTYRPPRVEQRRGLRVFVFSEEQIVPWRFQDED